MRSGPAAEILVRRLEQADIEAAADVLTQAFLNDPFYQYAIPDRALRLTQLPPFFATCLAYGLRYGHVWVAGRDAEAIEGAAFGYVFPEGYFTPERTSEVGFDAIDRMLGDASDRITGFSRSVEAEMQPFLPARSFFVDLIGTRPHVQGVGIGAAMLTEIAAYAKSIALPVALWTETPDALRFYQRHGYVLAAQGMYQPARAKWWALSRPIG